MLNEYNNYYWTTDLISHDYRALKAIWGGSSDHRRDHEQQIILEQWANSTNANQSMFNDTSSVTWTTTMVKHAYLETMVVFLLVILLYFTLVYFFCERKRDITRREVDRSVITRRVLPHGHSRDFTNSNLEDVTSSKSWRCFSRFIAISKSCCFPKDWLERKQITVSSQEQESANEILNAYRNKPHTPERNKSAFLCVHCNNLQSSRITNDLLEVSISSENNMDGMDISLTEEGLSGHNPSLLSCPICFEPFIVEENVTWSPIGHCRHVFHYDCILPWAVLGNYDCPVCRGQFWSNCDSPTQRCFPRVGMLDAKMRQSRFCVQHGLISP